MRGNRDREAWQSASARSIPAYAGEPNRRRPGPGNSTVYPRVCGGTLPPPLAARFEIGLSPRMRGNQPHRINLPPRLRSIPAYAGEPRLHKSIARCYRVYPRVCGGTGTPGGDAPTVNGLSPRMRGNRERHQRTRRRVRSIPAYAGEPSRSAKPGGRSAVYPRVCGGTRGFRRSSSARRGLSPRMRGNPRHSLAPSAAARSIPAYAGEPQSGAG